MREIKFRAWNKELKLMAYDVQNEYDTITGVRYWKYGKELDLEPGESSFGDYLSQTKYDVMQFTGLLDRNGKEIYEGDIVTKLNRMKGNFEVYWNDFGHWDCKCKRYATTLSRDCIVIGNIYENPELLK